MIKVRWNMTLCTWDVIGTSVGITWCQWHWKWHLFLRTRELKWGATWSCYAPGTGIGVTWCWWHHHWCHSIPYDKMIKRRCSMIFGHVLQVALTWKQHVMLMALSVASLHLLGSRWLKSGATLFSGHIMPLTLILASHDASSIVKGTTTFLTSQQSKWGATQFFVMWDNCHCF